MRRRALIVVVAASLVLPLRTPAQMVPAPRPGTPPPKQSQTGPWDHDVLVYRIGGDGQPVKLATLERSGVATVARMKDGRLVAAHQHFPQDDQRSFDRVAVRFSSDEGVNWTAPVAITVEGMEAGLARPFDPTLVPLPDGRVRLYFTSNRSRDFRLSTPAIYSAISSDGIRYAFEPGVRFAVDGRIVIDCAAALHDGTFHLIVPDNGSAADMDAGRQRREPPQGGRGYHAVSRDGLKFERAADVMLPGNRRWLGNMQSDGGRLVFFGTGGGGPGTPGGLWIATSPDGASWAPDPRTLPVPCADPGAVKLRDGSWLVLGTGPPRAGTAGASRGRQMPGRAAPGVAGGPR